MSAAAPPSAQAPAPEGTVSCPRCAAPVAPEQDWCLACGDAARTRLAPTPSWRAPIAILALVVALAGLALAIAFVDLTSDDARVPAPAPQTAPTTTAAATTG